MRIVFLVMIGAPLVAATLIFPDLTFVSGFVSGAVLGLIVPWIGRILSWLFTRQREGDWEIHVSYLLGGVDTEQKPHRVVVPSVSRDGLELSLNGIIGGVFRIEQGWPLAYPIGWLGKKYGFGFWHNEWEWWGYWTAHRQPQLEPRPQMKPGRPTRPTPPTQPPKR